MRRLSMILALAMGLAAFSADVASAAPHCTEGKACGNTCIKATDVCHIPTPPATPARSPVSA
jgi:hypothetical protein